MMKQEASAVIKVTLKKEAGSLPVANVDIPWELRIPGQNAITGSDKTRNDGKIVIKIKNVNLDAAAKYPLHITPTKTTGNVSNTLAAYSRMTLQLIKCSIYCLSFKGTTRVLM